MREVETITDHPRRGPGRPSIFSERVAEQILQRLADGESLRSICSDEGMPSAAAVRNWALDVSRYPEFSARYARARMLQYWRWADEVLELSDEAVGGDMATVQARRLQVDSRKWLLSKFLPREFGNLVKIEESAESQVHIYIPDNSRGAVDRPRLLQHDEETEE